MTEEISYKLIKLIEQNPEISQRQLAKELGVKMETFEVRGKNGVMRGLGALREAGCDVLLGIPDGTVYGGSQARMILRHCIRQRVVFAGVSKSYAKAGAVLATYADPHDQGLQAGEVVLDLLRDPRKTPGYSPPRRVRIAINMRAAKLTSLLRQT